MALASILCEKGDLDGNLARHIEVLEGANRSGCDLAVFPEMSLTGSVDPARPDHAIAIDHSAVNELIDAAGRLHVAVLFGLAERSTDGVHITQAYAHHRSLRGIQRKRHLGDGEAGFVVGVEAMACELGAVRFGFAQTLGDATDDARRRSMWVVACSSGTIALVSPDGDVVARLPAGESGVLTVDIPVAVDVEPVRHGIRVLVVDEANRTLLAQFGDDDTGRTWWVAPGGGMEPGEDDLATARRELHEELGRDDLVVGPLIGHRGGTFHASGRWLTQYERWYLCRTEHFEVDADVVAAVRAEGIRAMRWWSAEEIRAAGIDTGPRRLPELLDRIAAGDNPDGDTPLGM